MSCNYRCGSSSPRRRVACSCCASLHEQQNVIARGITFLAPLLQVRAETLKFKEEGVFAVVKDVFLPWYNAYRWVQKADDLSGAITSVGCAPAPTADRTTAAASVCDSPADQRLALDHLRFRTVAPPQLSPLLALSPPQVHGAECGAAELALLF